MVMRSVIQAVYRFRDATLVEEKKGDFGNALQNLYRELEHAEDLVARRWKSKTDRSMKVPTLVFVNLAEGFSNRFEPIVRGVSPVLYLPEFDVRICPCKLTIQTHPFTSST
jgi:hypothetical protein